jgi:hypothetical protein
MASGIVFVLAAAAFAQPSVIKRVADLDTNDEIGEYVCIDKDAPHWLANRDDAYTSASL